jgi:hypothetical protein
LKKDLRLAAGALFAKNTAEVGKLDWKSGVHVPNRAILERETSSNAKSNPFLGRSNAGGRSSRSNPKKLDWTCDLERRVEMLIGVGTKHLSQVCTKYLVFASRVETINTQSGYTKHQIGLS